MGIAWDELGEVACKVNFAPGRMAGRLAGWRAGLPASVQGVDGVSG